MTGTSLWQKLQLGKQRFSDRNCNLLHSNYFCRIAKKKMIQNCSVLVRLNLSRSMTEPTKWHLHPAKTQISLESIQSDQTSLCFQWGANLGPKASSCRRWRLIRVFAGCTGQFFGLSCCGSNVCSLLLFLVLLYKVWNQLHYVWLNPTNLIRPEVYLD